MIFGRKPKRRVIVLEVKRRPRQLHRSVAWKLAYADFVTAMMAFFLLLWIGTTFNKTQIEGIANYFNNPMAIPMAGGQGHGDRDAAIRGSGTDITRTQGQVSHGHAASQSASGGAAHDRPQMANLAELKGRLQSSMAKNNLLSQFKPQIMFITNHDGLQLQIVDRRQQPLFAGSSAHLTASAKAMLQAMGHVLSLQPNRISIEGHTDAAPYAGPKRDYSNWELSLDRANACRRALVAGGLPTRHILRVAGLGGAVPLLSAHPMDARNRRIGITLFTAEAAHAIEAQSGGGLTIHGDQDSRH